MPEPLDTTVNTEVYEFNAYVSPDEGLLVFSSYGRADDVGGGDLYFSRKDENGNWLPAKNVGPKINSEKLDYCPFVDLKNNNFYFTSEKADVFNGRINDFSEIEKEADKILNGMGNIFRVGLEELDLN